MKCENCGYGLRVINIIGNMTFYKCLRCGREYLHFKW